MIRIGQYDALDKWNIICRYWKDRGSVPDLGVNKLEQQRLPIWDTTAFRSGARACVDYVRARSDGFRDAPEKSVVPGGGSDPANRVYEQIGELVRAIGYPQLEKRVLTFADNITKTGEAGGAHIAGLPPELGDRLWEVFKSGAVHGLQWTSEVQEVPTIEILRQQAPSTFPTASIKNRNRVLSLFSAKYYGRSDVVHINDGRPGHVTLVDLDQECLEDMKLIYPRHWTYVHQDFAAFLHDAAESRMSFDVIVSDPFRGHGERVAWEILPLIMRLCTDTFITNYFVEMFRALGAQPDDLAALSDAIRARTGVGVDIVEVVQRSADVSWVVMRKRKRSTVRQQQPAPDTAMADSIQAQVRKVGRHERH